MFKKIGFAALVVLIQGCAFTTATLDVSYTLEEAKKGPISSASVKEVEVGDFEDGRVNKERIGWKQNGYGMNTADIITAKPVDEIVEEAVRNALQKNEFKLVSTANVEIVGSVKNFWFERKMNFWTVEFMGTVDVEISLINKETGEVLYSREYNGHYNEKSAGGYLKTWERVMNLALDNMMESFIFDVQVASAINSVSEPTIVAEKI